MLPADVVSALGDGNTMAGHDTINNLIRVSGGERVLSAGEVARLGGREAAMDLIRNVRAGNAEHLQSLPGPEHGGHRSHG